MYSLLEMGIFYCYVSLPEITFKFSNTVSQQNGDLFWDVHEDFDNTAGSAGNVFCIDPPRLKYFEVMRCNREGGAMIEGGGMEWIGVFFENFSAENLRIYTPPFGQKEKHRSKQTPPAIFGVPALGFFGGWLVVHFCW